MFVQILFYWTFHTHFPRKVLCPIPLGFCLRLQVNPTQLGPIDRANPYLRTLVPAPR
jgi:hypothetical protein